MKLMLTLPLLFAALTVQAEVFQVRTLERMRVVHCRSDVVAPPVVVVESFDLIDGQVTSGVKVEGDAIPADTACITLDSHISGAEVEGEIMVWGQPMERVLYSAAMRSGARAYQIADWATVDSYTENGARYRVSSRMQLTETGEALQYPIDLIRRSPEEQVVTLDDAEYVVPNYDRTTIISIERVTDDGVVIFMMDYRDD